MQGKKWGIKMRTPHYTQTTTVPTLFIVALPLHNNNILPSSRLFQNSPPTIHKLKIKSHHERSTFSSSLMTSHHANQPLRFPFFSSSSLTAFFHKPITSLSTNLWALHIQYCSWVSNDFSDLFRPSIGPFYKF